MQPLITGIHHVTAFARDPAQNIAFYTKTLGLRLVKRTINFDDPTIPHFYFGDRAGAPGTILTHFPDPRMKQGVRGAPEIRETTLAIPLGSIDDWRARLNDRGVHNDIVESLGEARLRFPDPDGMRLALVERPGASASRPQIDSISIHVPDAHETERFLALAFGFERSDTDGARTKLAHASFDQRIELVNSPNEPIAKLAAGSVHHVAWRVPNEEAQQEVASRLRTLGIATTSVRDRHYFRSIYFRIPGGVIFEVATDGPGFAIDEPPESLRLPPQYEPRREELQNALAPLYGSARTESSG